MYDWRRSAWLVAVLWAAPVTPSPAQTLTTVVNFNLTEGANPYSSPVQGTDGDFYGTTADAGWDGYGTVFKLSLAGTLTTLYRFCPQRQCSDGAFPYAGLVLATDGNFYGTTNEGGASTGGQCAPPGCGTVFKISAAGKLTTLYSFCRNFGCPDGAYPAGLVLAADGQLYGTTREGGSPGPGTIFRISLDGTLTTLYSFCSQEGCADGYFPSAGLIQSADGDFYGTTSNGGTGGSCFEGCGTLFRVTPQGNLTTLHSFDFTDGANPYGALVQAADGKLYGTTFSGGFNGDGTVFAITPGGTLTTLYSFCSHGPCDDGANPVAALVQATDGNFYGTTRNGGADTYYGTLFKITPNGALTTLQSFDESNGATPVASMIQATDGRLYGTTVDGGSKSYGTLFSVALGLNPFVQTLPASGRTGSHVAILGTDLVGATGVTFNGVLATFSVASPTLITTTVPAGATTGKIQVVTPSATLSSNVPFRVIP